MSAVTHEGLSGGSAQDSAYEISDEQITSLYQNSWALLPGLRDQDTVATIRTIFGASQPSPIISGPAEIRTESETLVIREGRSPRRG